MARNMKDSGVEWIGNIPEGWSICKLKNIIEFKNGYPFQSTLLSMEGNYPVIRISDICDGSIDIINANKIDDNNELESYLIKEKDILLAMSGATVGKLGYVSTIDTECYINQRVGIIRAKNSKYVYYYLSTEEFLKYIILLSAGSAQPNISTENVNNYYISLPNKVEQQKIVEFLDDKVGETNNIISKTKESMEEYKKYKNAIIVEAVTKGLDKTVLMKDSGIEWVGKMPNHWNVLTLSQVFAQLKNKNKELRETNLLSLSYGKVKRKDINASDGLLPESFDGYNIVDKNDIVLRLTDLQNDHKSLRVGHVKEKGIITSAYVTLRCKEDIETDYYYYFLHTFDIFKGFYGMGAGVRQGLNYDGIRSMKILSPDVKEQREIVEYLDAKCSEIDELIAKKEALIEELESYKKSLIYEYVTGKKEVL